MATVSVSSALGWTLADLNNLFGPIPFARIRQHPMPGEATEQDVLTIYQNEKRLCELVDGILVEKAMGLKESLLACLLIQLLRNFLDGKNLGTVAGEGGMMRLAPGLIRIPDVSYISWERFPGRT